MMTMNGLMISVFEISVILTRPAIIIKVFQRMRISNYMF